MQINKAVKIIVTGGAGFLGSFIMEELLEQCYLHVQPALHTHYDLTDQEDAFNLFYDQEPDVVIHAAAVVGGIGANQKEPGRFFYDNLQMGLNVIEAARQYNVKKLVVIGTTCSYPARCPTPFAESALWDGYPEETNAPYGIAKRALLTMCQAYREQYGLNAIYLIPANLYGPRDNFDLESGHVIPAIIRKCVEAVDQGRDRIELWGTGSVTRDFLYVRDAASMIVRAMEGYDAPQPMNIGTGQQLRIRDIAEHIAIATGFRGSFAWDKSKPDGQERRALDCSLYRNLLGHPVGGLTPVDSGLVETVAWYREKLAAQSR